MPKNTPAKRRREAARPIPAITPAARAAMLDRLADMLLQHGHHAAAERLAWRADALRSAAR